VLLRLRDQGQTVVVVEHDARLARSADWLIDLGPGPGPAGGNLLWSGPPAQLLQGESQGAESLTRRWLAETLPMPAPGARRDSGTLHLEGLHRHNLRRVAFDLRLGALNVVTGVSGAGKTSLLEEVVGRFQNEQVPGSAFQRIVTVDADPIGRTPRSNAATYTGAFDLIRDLFASSPEAKQRGLGKSSFSFNTAGGRCEACEGAGIQEVGMRYLGSVDLVCETCGGRRFHPEVLAVKLRGKNIADVLEGSIAEAAAHFSGQPRLRRILDALVEVGLGYLPLGQPATTLSGGEAQRVKLATELAKTSRGPALIALDEPSTGLHAADVAVLLKAWERLLEAGHTLLVVDNDLAVVRHGDQVLDLGPGSGPEGGKLVIRGTAQEVAACVESRTGQALRAGPAPLGVRHAPTVAAPIELEGVRTHNLKDLDLTLPAQGLMVVTGPSGSGKSSLVLDTLLAEAQNRFADLVSPWARRLLPRKGGAEFTALRGLQATLAVAPGSGRRNPRSTLGTATELDSLLRLLFARGGERPCPTCGRPAQGERCACGQGLPALWAADFSPQGERGACPHCKGLGFLQRCDPQRLVSDPARPLDGGAMDGTRFGAYLGEAQGQFIATLHQAATQAGLDLSGPWRDLGPAERHLAMVGTGDTVHEVAWRYRRGKAEGVHTLRTPWAGFANLVEREYERIHGDAKGEELEALLVDMPCPSCGGERLRELPRAVRFGGLRLPELLALPLGELLPWFQRAQGLAPRVAQLTEPLRQEITQRLQALLDAGLAYLTLERELASLAGGEAQRVRLATALVGGLVGVTYVLDEPSQGLHPRDVQRLGKVLRQLADAGNAVLLVEHDAALIALADQVVELGPGAGPEGGRLMALGTPAELKQRPSSRLGTEFRRAQTDQEKEPPSKGTLGVSVRGAHLHNLQEITVAFPLGVLVTVTGVSGSGKSSLVLEVLEPSLRNHLAGRSPVGCAGLDLPVAFQEVISARQEALGIAGTSTVLTLTGLSEPFRKRFAATARARELKLSARHFSLTAPGGRCEDCQGRGILTVAMDLLPDVTVGCETCQGQRFQPAVLACLLEGRNLAQVLDSTVDELAAAFSRDALLAHPLRALADVGLGYLRLGQEGNALSAGERQRLRLAGLLAEPPRGRAAILLDEPTRGLGFEDVDRLVTVLHRLAQAGHLVVAVEHNLDFIAHSDWILDLGPEGGTGGGRVVVEGPPAAVRACADSFTGQALANPPGNVQRHPLQ
jgi:excinuclease ABC subunit A